MNKRYIGAVIYLIPMLIILLLGGNVLKYGLMIISLMAVNELIGAFESKKFNPVKIIAYFSCVIYYFFSDILYSNASYILGLIIFIILGSLILSLFISKYNIEDAILTLFIFIYGVVLISFIYFVYRTQHGNYFVWLVFFVSWSCDVCAYYSGRFLGKRKLAPSVSPNKTIAGAIGGFMGSTLISIAFGTILRRFNIHIAIFHFAAIGALGGIMTQLGDLTASAIKRHVGIKDFSNLIPGHGGVLDRFDSIIFASVIVYYYVLIFLGA